VSNRSSGDYGSLSDGGPRKDDRARGDPCPVSNDNLAVTASEGGVGRVVLSRQEEDFWRNINSRTDYKTTTAIKQHTVVDIAVLPYAHTPARGDANAALKDAPLPDLELCDMLQECTAEAMPRHTQQ